MSRIRGRQRSTVIATRTCSFHDFGPSSEDRRFLLSLVGGIAALMLVLASAEQLQESHSGALAGGDFSIVDRIAAFRPQGPPPAFDVEDTTSEQAEPPARPSRSTRSTRATYGDANLRARPPQR